MSGFPSSARYFSSTRILTISATIIACFALIELLLDAALQSHREIGEYRGIDLRRLLDVPTRLLHLLRVVLGGNDAYEISGHHGFLGCEGNGKLAVNLQVVCGGVLSYRDHNLIHVQLLGPGGIN